MNFFYGLSDWHKLCLRVGERFKGNNILMIFDAHEAHRRREREQKAFLMNDKLIN